MNPLMWAVLIVCLAVSFVLSGMEAGVFVLSRLRIRQQMRAGLVSALDSMRNYNVGGLEVSFGQGAASGSRFVELTMINSQGKLIK